MNLIEETINLINSLNDIFYDFTNYEKISTDVCIVENIFEEKLNKAINKGEIEIIKSGEEILRTCSGMVVLGDKLNDNHRILITKERLCDKNLNFISTYFHELTHIHDLIDYWKTKNCTFSHELENYNDYLGFYFWTEFHAKYNGYRYYREMIFFDYERKTVENQINNIFISELPYNIENLKEDFNTYKHNDIQLIYCVVHFLARYSAWYDLFGEKFIGLPQFLYDIFGEKRITFIYVYLRKYKNYNDMKNKFEFLNQILLSLYSQFLKNT